MVLSHGNSLRDTDDEEKLDSSNYLSFECINGVWIKLSNTDLVSASRRMHFLVAHGEQALHGLDMYMGAELQHPSAWRSWRCACHVRP